MQEQEIQFKWLDAEIEILSETQRHLCEMIIEGHNDQEIIDCFHLRSHSNIRTCMKNTIMVVPQAILAMLKLLFFKRLYTTEALIWIA